MQFISPPEGGGQYYTHQQMQIFYIAMTSPAAGAVNPYKRATGVKKQTWRSARKVVSQRCVEKHS